MRYPKYKVWDTRKKTMHEVIDIKWLKEGNLAIRTTLNGTDLEPLLYRISDQGQELKEYVLIEFTGRKYNIDTEIFKGDLFVDKDSYEEDCRYCQVYEVTLIEGCWWLVEVHTNRKDVTLYELDTDDFLLVGNIYEGLNKEYLTIIY